MGSRQSKQAHNVEQPASQAADTNPSKLHLESSELISLKHKNCPIQLPANCDIFVGTIANGRKKVALKRIRGRGRSDEKIRAVGDDAPQNGNPGQFEQEAKIWNYARHTYILEFVGTATDEYGVPYLVSPWQDKGSLWEYINKKPKSNRASFLHQTAEALDYLHNVAKIIHGDIKAQNILVSSDERALLCDFGTSRYLDEPSPEILLGAGTRQWQCPELLHGKPTTCKSDIYAFGMTILQVVNGKEPFEGYLETRQIKAVLDGERPRFEPSKAPKGVSYDYLCSIAQRCWLRDPRHRPDVATVLRWIKAQDLKLIAEESTKFVGTERGEELASSPREDGSAEMEGLRRNGLENVTGSERGEARSAIPVSRRHVRRQSSGVERIPLLAPVTPTSASTRVVDEDLAD
ncbi:hypothetical protein FRB99_008958 [Tulasnella sp. 403]|nr:hypothetical protein FRB99_008958 [Tulasnella sp. 403]